MTPTTTAPVATVVPEERQLQMGYYSQSACNPAGLLNSVETRRLELLAAERCIHRDPVLRLLLEQVQFLTCVAPASEDISTCARQYTLDELLITLRDRRLEIITSDHYREVGTAALERDSALSIYSAVASTCFEITYTAAYDACLSAHERLEVAKVGG